MANNVAKIAAHTQVVFRYSSAVLAVLTATFVRWLLQDYLGSRVTFVTFYPAVALVAMFAGGGPGMLATFLSSVIVVVWLDFGHSSSGEVVALGLFIADALIVSTTAEMLHRAQMREADMIAERLVEQELELAEQDERYRLLADYAEDFVSLNDTEGNRLYVSPSFYRRTGWTPAEVQSSDWRARLHPEDLVLVERTRAANLAGETTCIEYRVHCRDGSWIWVEARCKPVTDAAGKVQRILLWAREITERKRAEAALRESHERLKRVLEVETVGVMFWDLSTGCMTDANDAFLKLMGYSRQEVEAGELTWQKLTPPEYVQASLAEIRKFQETGRVGPYEKEYLRKDGTRQWLVFAGSSLGNNTCVEFCVDIAARKNAEAALQDREERLRAVVNTVASAIITIDQRGLIVDVNPAAERMFGYTPAELLGQNVKMLMPSPYRDEHDRYIARYLKTGEPRIIGYGREVVGQRKDGSTFPVDLAVSQVASLDLFTGIVRDITDQKELQRQVLEISVNEQRRIGQELHDGTQQELTGLSLIAGTMLELLRETPEDRVGDRSIWRLDQPSFHQLCEFTIKLSQRLADANQHVRQLAHGIMPVLIDAEGLRAALTELAESINDLNGITCHFGCLGSASVANNTAATHLYRIAQEAVNNALRHGKASDIQISLEQQDGHLCLEVRDNGLGFDAAATPRSARAGRMPGMGLEADKEP